MYKEENKLMIIFYLEVWHQSQSLSHITATHRPIQWQILGTYTYFKAQRNWILSLSRSHNKLQLWESEVNPHFEHAVMPFGKRSKKQQKKNSSQATEIPVFKIKQWKFWGQEKEISIVLFFFLIKFTTNRQVACCIPQTVCCHGRKKKTHQYYCCDPSRACSYWWIWSKLNEN